MGPVFAPVTDAVAAFFACFCVFECPVRSAKSMQILQSRVRYHQHVQSPYHHHHHNTIKFDIDALQLVNLHLCARNTMEHQRQYTFDSSFVTLTTHSVGLKKHGGEYYVRANITILFHTHFNRKLLEFGILTFQNGIQQPLLLKTRHVSKRNTFSRRVAAPAASCFLS